MASHHHHQSNHHQSIHSHHHTCCCCSPCCSSSDPFPPTPTTTATTSDPLLQAIAAHLLQSPPPATHHPHTQQHFKSQHLQHPHQHQQQETQSLIHSLLRRVAALETSLLHFSSSPPKPSPPGPQPSPPLLPRLSVRDLAARTIQARFRLYLVRRSQTLRHLKHLASVRSHLAALKSSVSDRVHLSPKALSRRATDLRLQLESIQSTDPMIREGKRSISRELVRLMEFADGVSTKRQELSLKSMEIAEKGVDRRSSVEESGPGVDEVEGFSGVSENDEETYVGRLKMQASTIKPVKRVSFAENGKEPRVSSATRKPFTEEEIVGYGIGRLGGDGKTFLEELSREAEGIGYFSRVSEGDVGGHWEEGFHKVSDDEKSPRDSKKAGVIKYGTNGFSQSHNGSSHLMGLSAPLPVQMEPRRTDLKEKNAMVL